VRFFVDTTPWAGGWEGDKTTRKMATLMPDIAMRNANTLGVETVPLGVEMQRPELKASQLER
jgi:hypothetical protein